MSELTVICPDCHQPLSKHACPDVLSDALEKMSNHAMELERDAKDFALMIDRLANGVDQLTVGTASPKAKALAERARELVKRKGYAPSPLRADPPTAVQLERSKPSPFTPDDRDP